jgi:hypothetical protein
MSESLTGAHAPLVAELAETPAEAEAMARALDFLAFTAEPVAPPAGLKQRLLERLAEPERQPVFEAAGSYFARTRDMEWIDYAPGVRLKVLFDDAETGARTLLIEMAPDSPFPPHPHPEIEDLYLISGDAWVGDIPMAAGDYCRAVAGTSHNDVRSGPAGALAVVVSR